MEFFCSSCIWLLSADLGHVMDVLVLVGVAHEQVVAVLVCGKHRLRW